MLAIVGPCICLRQVRVEPIWTVLALDGVTHLCGAPIVNDWHENRSLLPAARQAAPRSRQGVCCLPLERVDVLDPETLQAVPREDQTMGAAMFRGIVVMKGYFRNPKAIVKAFSDGWFHSGDVGVMHPDG